MNYCPQCNAENTDENKFCFNCGKKLTEDDKPQTEADVNIAVSDTVTEPEANESNTPKEQKKAATLAEKSATASLVLSIVGAILFFALPIQILALILGIKGIRSERRVSASIGVGLAIFGLLGFIATVIFIIANYSLIINSDIFSYIYFTLFGY